MERLAAGNPLVSLSILLLFVCAKNQAIAIGTFLHTDSQIASNLSPSDIDRLSVCSRALWAVAQDDMLWQQVYNSM